MPEARLQRMGICPEIAFEEVRFPDDADFGTGTFTAVLSPRALLSPKVIFAVGAVNRPTADRRIFQISATIYPNRDIPVLLEKDDLPVHQVIFQMPHWPDLRVAQTLTVEFSAWRIVGAAMGGQALSAGSDLESH
jgi:hypothetical protein